MSLDLGDVYEQIAARLLDVPDLTKVFDYPPGKITPPAAILSYPEQVEYNLQYGPDGWSIPELPLVLVCGRLIARKTRVLAAEWASLDGPASIKTILESGTYTAFDDLTVPSVSFDGYTEAGVDYLAATFPLQIIGS